MQHDVDRRRDVFLTLPTGSGVGTVPVPTISDASFFILYIGEQIISTKLFH